MLESGIYKIESICKPERVYIGSAVSIKKGMHRSEESRKRYREGVKKRPPISEETRENLRISHKGQVPWNLGISGYSSSKKGKHYKKSAQ